jgi:hypothetical protein
VQGGGSGVAIHLCMEWSLRLSIWLSSPVQGGGSGEAMGGLAVMHSLLNNCWAMGFGVGVACAALCVIAGAWTGACRGDWL